MQVLVDLDFFPQEIGLDSSIAVQLIRDINSSLRKMFYSQRKIPYLLWENGSRHVSPWPDLLNSPLFELWEKDIGEEKETFYGFNIQLRRLLQHEYGS